MGRENTPTENFWGALVQPLAVAVTVNTPVTELLLLAAVKVGICPVPAVELKPIPELSNDQLKVAAGVAVKSVKSMTVWAQYSALAGTVILGVVSTVNGTGLEAIRQ